MNDSPTAADNDARNPSSSKAAASPSSESGRRQPSKPPREPKDGFRKPGFEQPPRTSPSSAGPARWFHRRSRSDLPVRIAADADKPPERLYRYREIDGMVERVVKNSVDGHWQPPHAELLSGLKNQVDQAVEAEIGPIARDLAKAGNWKVALATGVSRERMAARNKLEDLRARSAHLHEEPLPEPHETEKPTNTRWLMLFTVIAVCIVGESAINMSLLAPALDTGLLGAFLTAGVVSLVNVGGLGTGLGLLLFQAKRFGIGRPLFFGILAAITTVVLVFNLIVGRHRESFERLIEMREQAGGPTGDISLSSARELAAEISLNPMAWELRSFLFTLLGVFLCGVGLYKGYTFFRISLVRELRERRERIEGIRREYEGLSGLHRDRLEEEMKREVTDVIVRLDSGRQVARQRLRDLATEWNHGSHLAYAESHFITEWIRAHPDAIDQRMLDEHKAQPGVEPPPIDMDNAMRTIQAADALATLWRERDSLRFVKEKETGCREINESWMSYRPLIDKPLAELSAHLSNGLGVRERSS